MAVFYCIRLSMVTDMLLYFTTVEGWQHVKFFSQCRSFWLGVNHLIVFKTKLTVSCKNPLLICLMGLSSLSLAAPAFSCPLLAVRLHSGWLATYGIAIGLRKIRGRTEIRTADPWRSKLLHWPLDHATPPNVKRLLSCAKFIPTWSWMYEPSTSTKKCVLY